MAANQILTAEQARDAIVDLVGQSSETILLSAYFTDAAASFLKGLSFASSPKIVIRARPNDFAVGASNISAVESCLDQGWDIRFISALHAKAYLISDKILVGSGNLTSNGLHLLGTGNIELNSLVQADDASKGTIRGVFSEAERFTPDLLERMQNYIATIKAEKVYAAWWPEEVLPMVSRKMFCSDFPQFSVSSADIEQEPWHEIRSLVRSGHTAEAVSLLESADAYNWLLGVVKDKKTSVRFGEVTADLHDALADDPAPYRRVVKDLLANLLSYIEACDTQRIKISRPRHTQVIEYREQ